MLRATGPRRFDIGRDRRAARRTAVAALVDTVLLVTVPGLGDAVQAIKAGVLEIADIVVVNMADRPGVTESARQMRAMLDRRVRVLTTIATDGHGVDELREELDRTWSSLQANGDLPGRRRAQERHQVQLTASAWLAECVADLAIDRPLPEAVGALLEEAARRWRT
jgi:LAO/AO transport system kinase